MKKTPTSSIERGQAISFRVPSDTPDHIVKHLQKLKETERRNFSSKIAEFVIQGVSQTHAKERESITIPLPKTLTKAQKAWLKHEHSEALLGTILYQLIADPVRATSLLAHLNSNRLDLDEALYLQEEVFPEEAFVPSFEESRVQDMVAEVASAADSNSFEDDLDSFDWELARDKASNLNEEMKDEEPDADDLLGGFLANMNK
ncbi:hypothetical protein [Bacillus sp. MRMR6]|uniref:hypothetical protein n=1 Tax=Bacillus sp. MRMR6 TaxID=1928617 RepID=UPI000951E855|nr:hypothetical protein [Bacillus sp. MRMR6]OLS41300.1 hypothetical protein BTR25_05430 [Bacillus sp. MRMR6]